MKMPRNGRMLIVLAVVLVVVAGLVSVAMAQPAPQQGQQTQDGNRGGDMRGMIARAQTNPVIAATDDAVFLFVRNTLYKFDANTLELLAQTDLPTPERRERPAEQ